MRETQTRADRRVEEAGVPPSLSAASSPAPRIPPLSLSLPLAFLPFRLSFPRYLLSLCTARDTAWVPAGENTVAWWGEGSKRVSDCPLGDEAKEREREGGEEEEEKGRLIALASNSTAGCHPWLGGEERE